MKKEYIEPTIEIVEAEGSVLLTGSLQVFDDEAGASDVLAPEGNLDIEF
jgi:hypothetical protein